LEEKKKRRGKIPGRDSQGRETTKAYQVGCKRDYEGGEKLGKTVSTTQGVGCKKERRFLLMAV